VRIPQGSGKFIHFGSRFTRRPFYPPVMWWTGGLFWVKVAGGREKQTNHYQLRRQNPSFAAARTLSHF